MRQPSCWPACCVSGTYKKVVKRSTYRKANHVQPERQPSIHEQGEPLSARENAGNECPVVDLAQLAAEQGKNNALSECESCESEV